MRIKILSALLLVTLALFVSDPVNAATENVTILPSAVKTNVEPGGTITKTLNITNNSDTPGQYKIYSSSYTVEGENYSLKFTAPPNQPDISKWVRLDDDSFSLKAHEKRQVSYSIVIPPYTTPGGYYGVIFAEVGSNSKENIVFRKRVGALLYLTVAGEATEKGNVLGWDIKPVQTGPPIKSVVRLANVGNTHYQAKVAVSIYDIFGNKISDISSLREILPGTIRAVETDWQSSPELGLFTIKSSVTFLGETQDNPSQRVLIISPLGLLGVTLTLIATVLLARSSVTYFRKSRA